MYDINMQVDGKWDNNVITAKIISALFFFFSWKLSSGKIQDKDYRSLIGMIL